MRNVLAPREEEFFAWVDDGYPGSPPETVEFLDEVLDPTREMRLWPGQRAGLLRTIFAFEVMGKRDLLLNIVTGGGKTAIIAACIAWLRRVHDVRSFLIICPNTIVRDRLRTDFQGAKVFYDFELFSPIQSHFVHELGLHVLEPGAAPQGMLESGIVIANIQQLYGKESNERLAFVMNHLGELAVFNDEAHNTPAVEYTEVLKALAPKTLFRLDTTATPDRADGQEPDSEMVYEYGIPEALDDGIIKSTVVYQPDIAAVELTFTDPDTGAQVSVEEIDWEKIDNSRVKSTKWVTDPEPRRQQLKIALARLDEQKKRAAGRYKPILFVVAVGIADAQATRDELEKTFKIKALVVTEESDADERREAMAISDQNSPYEAIVSVLMLREGWDVPEVSVIALLRKFSSPVYGQQVIGRGLRKVVREPGEREILCVVDHPKLEHDWLWDLIGAKVKKGVKTGDQFDLEEDLPPPTLAGEPKLIRNEKLIEVPQAAEDEGDVDFNVLLDQVPDEDEPRKDWAEVLAAVAYPQEAVEITTVTIKGIKSINLDAKGFVKFKPTDADGPKQAEVFTEQDLPDARELAEQLKEGARSLAEELLFEKGFAGRYKGELYGVILDHVTAKLLDDKPLGSSSSPRLLYAIGRMPDVSHAFMQPGLVAGIVKFPPVETAA